MTFPTTVYVLMQQDTQGRPRGFHKALPIFYFEQERASAERKCRDSENNALKYTVQECVIMSREKYDELRDLTVELLSHNPNHGQAGYGP